VKTHRIVNEAYAAAPPEAVWRLLADPLTWPSFSPVGKAVIERPGTTEPTGLGMIRRLQTGPLRMREEVVASDAPRHHAYILLSGMNLRDYRGDVTLTPEGAGTRIHWEVSFTGAFPGAVAFWKPGLAFALKGFAKGIARAAEQAGRAA
jgi:carbon monoxide dehydrogenase subunit G